MATKRQRRKRRKRLSVDGAGDASKDAVAGASKAVAGATGTSEGDISPTKAAGSKSVRRGRDPQGPPPPPWGSFPLSELVILVAIILLIGGFFVQPPRGGVMIGVGLGLGSLAGLELAVREHFAAYRSHSLLLGGAAGVAVVALLFALGPDSLPLAAAVAIGAVIFAAAAYGFALAFRRRSGGELFRFRA
jgi:hypothetical protein